MSSRSEPKVRSKSPGDSTVGLINTSERVPPADKYRSMIVTVPATPLDLTCTILCEPTETAAKWLDLDPFSVCYWYTYTTLTSPTHPLPLPPPAQTGSRPSRATSSRGIDLIATLPSPRSRSDVVANKSRSNGSDNNPERVANREPPVRYDARKYTRKNAWK